MIIDFELWANEEDYNSPIKYIDDNGNIKEEKLSNFTSISRVLKRRGYLFEKEFINICEWKTKRQKNRYERNSKEEIKKVTKTIISIHPNTKRQIYELTHLKGVGVPVASAILTVIFPEYYCLLDYRAWRALLWVLKLQESKSFCFKDYTKFSRVMDDFRNYPSLDSYIRYLEKIKKLAKQNNMTPRKIEMALWIYDKKNGIL